MDTCSIDCDNLPVMYRVCAERVVSSNILDVLVTVYYCLLIFRKQGFGILCKVIILIK